MVALISAFDPMNINCFLEPRLKEVQMYKPLKRDATEQIINNIERFCITQCNHALRVKRVLPLFKSENEVDALNDMRSNEWAGAGRSSCSKRVFTTRGQQFLVYALDVVIISLAAITCDMPRRDKTMGSGGIARVVGCALHLFKVRSCKTCNTYTRLLYIMPLTMFGLCVQAYTIPITQKRAYTCYLNPKGVRRIKDDCHVISEKYAKLIIMYADPIKSI